MTLSSKGHRRHLPTVLGTVLVATLFFASATAHASGANRSAPEAPLSDSWMPMSDDSVVQYLGPAGNRLSSWPAAALSSIVPFGGATQGYITGADELLDAYVIRLVAAPNIEKLRPYAELVARELSRGTARSFSVAPGVITASDGASGFIDFTASASASPCGSWGNASGGTWGCGGYRAQIAMDGVIRVVSGSVWLAPFAADGLSDANLTTLMLHEFGHAVSLDHFMELYGGQRQIMYPQISPATHSSSYRAGDMNGLRYLGAPKSSASPQPTSEIDRRDPHNQAWVAAIVNDLLGSERGAGVKSEWQQAARSGFTRTQIARFLASSPAWTDKVVTDLYREALGREPDAGGAAYWGAQLARGVQPPAIAANIWGSAEYVAKAGSAEAWVQQLYAGLLNRSADSAGLAYWVAETRRVGFPRVASSFYQSKEKRMSRVNEQYKLLLGRSADRQGSEYWANRVLASGDLELTVELADSSEYRMRAIERFPNG